MIRRTLQARFIFSIALLLTVLVTSILFVIQKREANTIFEESKKKGILDAKNIAFLNLQPLIFWDVETIKRSIEEMINDKLLYIIFYDRYNSPLVATDSIKDAQDIYCCSRLPLEVDEGSHFFEAKKLKIKNRLLRILEIEIPVFAEGSETRWGSVKIGLSLEDMHREIQKTRLMLMVIGLLGLLLGILGATLLARRITRPLKKLAEGTVKISQGDFTYRLEIDSPDEIGDLARSFNEMSSQLWQTRKKVEEANQRLIQSEKLASIGRLAATIAHEIRNPLTSVKLNIQKVFQSERLDDEAREHLEISQQGIVQIERFIKELLNFTRASELNLERFSLEQIMEEAIKVMNNSFEEKKILLRRKYQKNLPEIFVDGDKMRQVFLNILRNAYEAVEDGGRISLSLSLVRNNEQKKFKLKISDNGCGIPEERWEVIFEPFYTTKPFGFGLGLANARKIVEQHGGTIRVVKKEGKGSAFEILLPLEEAK